MSKIEQFWTNILFLQAIADFTCLLQGHNLFEKVIFRSPDELRSLAIVDGTIRTAIYFQKEDEPDRVPEIELEGQRKRLNTGAFLAARWEKP